VLKKKCDIQTDPTVGMWLNAVWLIFTEFTEENNASVSALDALKKEAIPS